MCISQEPWHACCGPAECQVPHRLYRQRGADAGKHNVLAAVVWQVLWSDRLLNPPLVPSLPRSPLFSLSPLFPFKPAGVRKAEQVAVRQEYLAKPTCRRNPCWVRTVPR